MRDFIALALFGGAAVAQAADGEQARKAKDDDDDDDDDFDDLDDDDDKAKDDDDDDDDFDDDDDKAKDDDDDDDDFDDFDDDDDKAKDDEDDDDDDDFDDIDLDMPRLSRDFDRDLPEADKQARHTACARAVRTIDPDDRAVKDAVQSVIDKAKEAQDVKTLSSGEAMNLLIYSSSIACYFNIDQAEAAKIAAPPDTDDTTNRFQFKPDHLVRLFARDVTTPQQFTAEQQTLFDAAVKQDQYSRLLSGQMGGMNIVPLGASMSPVTQLLYLVGVLLCLGGAGLWAVKRASATPRSSGGDKSDGNRKQRRQQEKKRK